MEDNLNDHSFPTFDSCMTYVKVIKKDLWRSKIKNVILVQNIWNLVKIAYSW